MLPKSLQIREVKAYRAELHRYLEDRPDLPATDSGVEQPNWESLSVTQKNAILFDQPHRCAVCGYGFMLTPCLKPNENVYVRIVKCPRCGNVDEVSRLYEA